MNFFCALLIIKVVFDSPSSNLSSTDRRRGRRWLHLSTSSTLLTQERSFFLDLATSTGPSRSQCPPLPLEVIQRIEAHPLYLYGLIVFIVFADAAVKIVAEVLRLKVVVGFGHLEGHLSPSHMTVCVTNIISSLVSCVSIIEEGCHLPCCFRRGTRERPRILVERRIPGESDRDHDRTSSALGRLFSGACWLMQNEEPEKNGRRWSWALQTSRMFLHYLTTLYKTERHVRTYV